jgi:hypothetical protein
MSAFGVKRRSLFSPEFLAFGRTNYVSTYKAAGEKTGFGGRETNGHASGGHPSQLEIDF